MIGFGRNIYFSYKNFLNANYQDWESCHDSHASDMRIYFAIIIMSNYYTFVYLTRKFWIYVKKEN